MSKILLLGSNGQLGSDILRVFRKNNNIIPSSHRDLDILNFKKVKSVISKIKPEIIVNCAAYHKVDEVEKNPQKAFLVNATAQMNLAKVTNDLNATIVFISTDYVFGRENKRKKPYVENDCPAPVNVYGLSKMAGEEMTRIHNRRHFIIRTSGLYGSTNSTQKGDNFVEKMVKLSKTNNEIKVVNDQFLSPTSTKNVANNLLLLLNRNTYDTYHMVSEGQCSWWEFTKQIFKYLNIDTLCAPVSSSEFKTVAQRPSYSVLVNNNLNKIGINRMKSWEENLKEYLVEKNYLD